MLEAIKPHQGKDEFPLKKRRTIYNEGSPTAFSSWSPFCFKLCTGVIGLRRTSKAGDPTYVGMVCEGELFGEEILTRTERRHDAVALVDSIVVRVLLSDEITKILFADVFKRYHRLEEVFATRTVGDRVALLRSLVNGHSLTKTDFAFLASASRERLSKITRSGQIDI